MAKRNRGVLSAMLKIFALSVKHKKSPVAGKVNGNVVFFYHDEQGNLFSDKEKTTVIEDYDNVSAMEVADRCLLDIYPTKMEKLSTKKTGDNLSEREEFVKGKIQTARSWITRNFVKVNGTKTQVFRSKDKNDENLYLDKDCTKVLKDGEYKEIKPAIIWSGARKNSNAELVDWLMSADVE